MILIAASALEDFDCPNVARALQGVRDDILTVTDLLDDALFNLEDEHEQTD